MSDSTGLFAAAEIGHKISKSQYNDQLETLRVELLNLQHDLKGSDFSAVILIAGDDRPGVVSLLRALHEWMDARYLQNHVMFNGESLVDANYSMLHEYWQMLPPVGRIGLFVGGWPANTVRCALDEGWSRAKFDNTLAHAERFEKLLVDDGTLVLKFWLHLPKSELKERIAAADADPKQHWDFAQHDWEVFDRYKDAFELIERLVLRTNSAAAPWHIVESTQERYRNITVAQHVADALAARLDNKPEPTNVAVRKPQADGVSLLDQIDLSASVDKDDYEDELGSLQAQINKLAHKANKAGISCVFVFEGVDAAGKGGAIRRLARGLPVQHVRIFPISAPDEAERARHYLWRFWTRLPARGEVSIFDRSWYGRVLVERVEGFATEQEWSRAYDEINEFEATLTDSDVVVCKFWLQIDADEQLDRFNARAETPYKKYKLTPDDFRNREKWGDYRVAAHDMIARTSTSYAPWTLVAANDKRHARLKVLRTIVKSLEAQLKK